MTFAQVVETSVTNDSSFQNYPHPDDHTIRSKDILCFHEIVVRVSPCFFCHFDLVQETNALKHTSVNSQQRKENASTMTPFKELRWLSEVFNACVSFTFVRKTLDPLVTKNGNTQFNNTNFGF